MKKLLLVFAFAVMLSACAEGQSPGQIREDGNRYMTMTQADQLAMNEEQARQFKAQDQAVEMTYEQYRIDLWNTWKPAIVSLGIFAIGMMYVPLAFTALVACYVVWGSGRAAVRMATIYSGVIPIDKQTRLPRMVMMDAPAALPDNSILARIQDKTGIQLVNTHGKKWTAFNGATGQVYGRLDEDTPVSVPMLELVRQIILSSNMQRDQKATAMFSRAGQVAEAMGHSTASIPGPSIIDVDHLLEKLQDRMINDE